MVYPLTVYYFSTMHVGRLRGIYSIYLVLYMSITICRGIILMSYPYTRTVPFITYIVVYSPNTHTYIYTILYNTHTIHSISHIPYIYTLYTYIQATMWTGAVSHAR